MDVEFFRTNHLFFFGRIAENININKYKILIFYTYMCVQVMCVYKPSLLAADVCTYWKMNE